MQPVRAVTFDAGGTLLYPSPSVGAIYSEVMRDHGLRLDANTLNAAFRRAWKLAHQTPRVGVSEESERDWWRGLVRETLNGLGEVEDFEKLFDALWHTFAEPRRWALHDGAMETLKGLRERGYRLAVLSNWDQRLRSLLDGMQLSPLVDEVVISSEVGVEKPDPKIFRITEKRLGFAPGEILHVGDSPHHDVNGARNVGWRCVLVTHRKPGGEDAAKEEGEIRSLGELLEKMLPVPM